MRRHARMLGLVFALTAAFQAPAQTRPDEAAPPGGAGGEPLRVALLVLEGVYNSELMAPMDIFHHTVFHAKPGMEVFTVGRSAGSVTSFEGLEIGVQHDLESAPPFDVLVVPSAVHNMDSDLEDERLIAWVRERGRSCRHVLSVCDGAFVLAEAGLLDGRFCTTFPGDIAALRDRYPKLAVVEGVTFVSDGPAVTGVGGARSYEPALYLVEHLYGSRVAAGVARGMVLDWDLDRERRLVVPAEASSRPRCWLPGQRIDSEVTVEDEHGRPITLGGMIAARGDVKAVVLCVLAGAEAKAVAGRGGVWCEDTFSELANLRHLRLRYGSQGVLFVGVACPPVYHEERFGFDQGAFLERAVDDPVYLRNRERFVAATRTLEEAGALPFDVVVYDPRFRLLGAPPAASRDGWHGRFRWFEDSQTYGTPTTWVMTGDLEVLGPPFFMNVYESEGRKLRYTPEDVARMIDVCLPR